METVVSCVGKKKGMCGVSYCETKGLIIGTAKAWEHLETITDEAVLNDNDQHQGMILYEPQSAYVNLGSLKMWSYWEYEQSRI